MTSIECHKECMPESKSHCNCTIHLHFQLQLQNVLLAQCSVIRHDSQQSTGWGRGVLTKPNLELEPEPDSGARPSRFECGMEPYRITF